MRAWVCLAIASSGCVVLDPGVSAGIRALDGGRPSVALSAFDEAAREFPDSPLPMLDRGVTLFALKRHDDAIAAFERALALDDGRREARLRNDLGLALARSGRSLEARAEFRAALRANPGFDDARHNLEVLLTRRPAKARMGMADRLHLGSEDLSANPEVFFEAWLEPRTATLPASPYWVVHVFETFDGREWSNPESSGPPRSTVVLRSLGSAPLVQRIVLRAPYQSRTLVGFDEPVAFDQAEDGAGDPVPLFSATHDEAAAARVPNRYRVVSGTPGAEVAPLVARERWLQLPPLDERVAPLAARVLAGAKEPEVAAERLRRWFEREYRSSLAAADAFADDPLAAFLFVRRAGHCEQVATALAVLLRTQGFPARVVGGFRGGEWREDHYELTGNQAHAWAQVFSPTRGWVTIDPVLQPESTDAGAASPLRVLTLPSGPSPSWGRDGGMRATRDW